jgi:Mrp family chromosome partitioning ATPase
MGVVPLAGEDPSNPKHFETIFRDKPEGVLAESFRQFRTSLIKQLNAAGTRRCLVCSGVPGSGATGVVTEPGAAPRPRSTCACSSIDANYRRPGIHTASSGCEGAGLADVLAGTRTSLGEAGRHQQRPAPASPPASRELRVFERLGTAAMDALLAEARRSYDLVLVDAAPTIVAGDAMALATRCDASMLVVRAIAEKRGMVNRIKNELARLACRAARRLVNGVRAAAGGYMKRNIRTTPSSTRTRHDAELAGRREDKQDKKPGPDA